MKLRRQLFTAFLTVAMLPVVLVGIYTFVTNLTLAFDLHAQNMQDSTQIQVDLLEDHVNRLMVRTRQFASASAVRAACRGDGANREETTASLSSDILNFTDETLDHVAIFALLDRDGNFLYSSGSNSDNQALRAQLPDVAHSDQQYVTELSFTGDNPHNLIICTPVRDGGEIVGRFLVVGRTDYLLKLISSHRQLESSNALIYCREHREIVVSKQDVSGPMAELDQQLSLSDQGSLTLSLDGRRSLAYYTTLSKTPWVLVSTVSAGQIFSLAWSYGLVNITVLLLVLVIILVLSRRQSRKMLYPMDQLLAAVGKFFLGDERQFPKMNIDPKSEIGYLAEKFTGLSADVALAQGRLKESNYLYAALLQATYEFRMVIDLQSDTVECSSGTVAERVKSTPGHSAPERVLAFLTEERQSVDPQSTLRRAVYGDITQPVETEACFTAQWHGSKRWYRVVAVPMLQEGLVWRVALHFEDITDQKQEELRLIHSSQTDSLCGVLNKAAFPLHCTQSSNGRTDAMFFIDLDQFKEVNDTLGHAAGDNVLVATAHAIRTQFREIDVVGRFGGDEFVAFAPGITAAMAQQKAQRLLETISFPLDTPKGALIHVTASIGVCMATAAIPLDQVIAQADAAMYHAKENGRAQYHLVEPHAEK